MSPSKLWPAATVVNNRSPANAGQLSLIQATNNKWLLSGRAMGWIHVGSIPAQF